MTKNTKQSDSIEIGKFGPIYRLGFNLEDFVPIVVQFGNFNLKKSDDQKKVFESKGFRFVIALETEPNGKTKKWLLTAFDIIKRPK